jgi:hypothetical protein
MAKTIPPETKANKNKRQTQTKTPTPPEVENTKFYSLSLDKPQVKHKAQTTCRPKTEPEKDQ